MQQNIPAVTLDKFQTLVREAMAILPHHRIATALDCNRTTLHRWKGGQVPMNIDRISIDLQELLYGKNNRTGCKFTFIDLFAGIGGMRLGFQAVGGRCVFTSEWDRFARETYQANFPNHHGFAGDIKQIDALDIPDHNVLLAGFPCQPFSLAGVSKKNALGREHGFKDKTQGTLFFDIKRIIEVKQPNAFLLENVKNLHSHDGGRTMEVILNVLRNELGYHVPDPRIIDARTYVPQHRERTYIVGFKEPSEFTWDDFRLPRRQPTLDSVLHPEDGTEILDISEGGPYLDENGNVLSKYTLSGKLWKYLKDYRAKHEAKGNGFGYSLFDETGIARTLSARYHKDGSEILISRGPRSNPRRLTPRECARLMGFDTPLGAKRRKKRFIIPVSDTQAYRQFGNAVVVPVVRKIAKTMEPHILDAISGKTKRSQDAA